VHQKFATTVKDTGSKFAAGVNYTCTKEANGKFSSSSAGVVDTGGNNELEEKKLFIC
jgi:hypothetical protein